MLTTLGRRDRARPSSSPMRPAWSAPANSAMALGLFLSVVLILRVTVTIARDRN